MNNQIFNIKNPKIAIIGLGYVGLPLAHAFSIKYKVVGFDIAQSRIDELKNGYDRTLELSEEQVKEAISNGMEFTNQIEDIKDCNIYIVTVPTPIDEHKTPDLTPLLKASETIGKVLKKGDIVIYESTVYPGATEEDCVPVLEKVSGLKFNKDFFCGYSPERINPGDKEHTVTKILKVTSGSTPEVAKYIDELYKSVITAGTHLAPSIKVAEAAKVIENAQRDINIAFVNELALIFDKLGIDTHDVLKAAGTKWNFLPFKPGLVGGHCIGVDPYYLTYKAKEVGYHPEVILAGRRINDNMGVHVANKVVKLMIHKGHTIKGSKVLVLGITFKENCPDIRNSRVIDVIRELQEFGCNVDVYDPWADAKEVKDEYGLDLLENGSCKIEDYNAIVLAVAHNEFKELDDMIQNLNHNIKDSLVIYDIKSTLNYFNERL
ncbi:Vi polysaccharide biosynthesis UDP-N-acetylglucosamine C-6 dehydrogenase TviB [Hydrogenimonas thermophila]|uniref:Vi polysaccharide biosynthesis UDP-N-acetylglucosamine C-6 dehydrogenase TviB n=1 Tax=Hydrogenimonas thermophila TaxID=223786 RepID=UPI002936E627|nr:Vi polysaccharide biosynthesis UDP-N-acetylglucosamine C-6 dehydrogenase TviB [Hydrogenimonas thermophila]WOE70103.1 Vi polysaccharide biosynthesis UDP-N-acetylglucosamine C-6 dehydrogenase TviB [Hydrogenimonas thermophila]WOE72620.1 Vi polysaccharide biosynthesis UDP-N-acetylglucosamine C-6 dehydrogenase TviB [Hydrogenimonas thermophila]